MPPAIGGLTLACRTRLVSMEERLQVDQTRKQQRNLQLLFSQVDQDLGFRLSAALEIDYRAPLWYNQK
jgi:hypothetical protein